MSATNTAELLSKSRDAHLSGDLAKAAVGYARILQDDPQCADAWHLAGLISHQSGRSENAIRQIGIAIRIDQQAEYFSNLAAILNKTGRHEDASLAAQRAAEIDADFAPAQFQQGVASAELSRFDEAQAHFDRSLGMGFEVDRVRHCMAEAQSYAGDTRAAQENLLQAIQENPSHPTGYFQLASFVRSGQCSFTKTHVKNMQTLLSTTRNDLVAQSRLYMALAIHWERQKDYPVAFRHYRLGNSTKRQFLEAVKGEVFRPVVLRQNVADMIEYFSADRISNLQQEMAPLRDNIRRTLRPIFIVGMPRSGSTLLQQIVSQHSLVRGGGELPILPVIFRNKIGIGEQKPLSRTLPTIDASWLSQTVESYLEQADSMLQTPDTNATYFVDKMLENYMRVGFLHVMFPDSPIINCQRDPRDTCLSCYCQSFESNALQLATSSLQNLSHVFRAYAQMMDHWERVLPGRVHRVVYENVLDAPESQIRRLLDVVGLDWEGKCLAFHESKSPVRTASVNQVRKPLYKSSKEKWRRYENELAPLQDSLAAEIARFEHWRSTDA